MPRERRRTVHYTVFMLRDGTVTSAMPVRKPAARILKREVSPPLSATFGQLVLAGMLAAPALFFALVEAAIGRGGVLRVVARPSQK
jgi:hypothetical protein